MTHRVMSQRSYHGATCRSFPDGFPSPLCRKDKCVFLVKFEILLPDISEPGYGKLAFKARL